MSESELTKTHKNNQNVYFPLNVNKKERSPLERSDSLDIQSAGVPAYRFAYAGYWLTF